MLLNFQCERPINLDTGSARVGCSRNRCGIEVVSIINLILHVCSGWNGGGGGCGRVMVLVVLRCRGLLLIWIIVRQ